MNDYSYLSILLQTMSASVSAADIHSLCFLFQKNMTEKTHVTLVFYVLNYANNQTRLFSPSQYALKYIYFERTKLVP